MKSYKQKKYKGQLTTKTFELIMDSMIASTPEKVSTDQIICRQQIRSELVVKVNRLSSKQIQKYDNAFYEEFVKTEPQTEDISRTEFMRYMGLIATKKLATKPIEELKQSFPIRKISQIGRQLTDDSNRVVLDRNIIYKQNFKSFIKRQTKPQIINSKPKHLSKQEIEKQKKFKKTIEKRRQISAKSNEKNKIKKFLSSTEFSTKLFERLNRTFGCHQLSPSDVQKLAENPIEIPVYESNRKLLESEEYVKYNNWKPSDIERKAHKSELHFKLKGKPFVYTFTRRQRLEKCKRLATGLNWQSRLKLMSCNDVSVKLQPICLLCWKTLNGTHVCKQQTKQLILSSVNDKNQSIDSNVDFNYLLNESIVSDTDNKTDERNDKEIEKMDEILTKTESKEMTPLLMNNKKKPLDEIDVNFQINSESKLESRKSLNRK